MPADRLSRARSAIGTCRYGLGNGGYSPSAAQPGQRTLRRPQGKTLPVLANWCDCSGFVAWVLGRSRKPDKSFRWWLSTDSIWSDAKGLQSLFRRLDKPVAGCIAVYPDTRDGAGKHHEGHVAIVADPAAHTVIDCSGSHDGISEHEAGYFWRRGDVVWCVPQTDAP